MNVAAASTLSVVVPAVVGDQVKPARMTAGAATWAWRYTWSMDRPGQSRLTSARRSSAAGAASAIPCRSASLRALSSWTALSRSSRQNTMPGSRQAVVGT